MHDLPSEIRFLFAFTLNAAVLTCAWRFSKRRGSGDAILTLLDTLLLWHVVQYVAVGLPGMLGVLSFGSIAGTALLLSAALWFGARTRSDETTGPLSMVDRRIVLGGVAIVAGMIAAQGVVFGALPTFSNDALTYHLPAAAQWLQTHRIGLFETWFYNPANTYSPLAGSMFIAWWMAPFGNDVVARFVEVPPLILLFVTVVQLARELGADIRLATLLAMSVALARPFLAQVTLAKDDLFVAAFFISAVAGLSRDVTRDRLAPWRFGAAVGLMLATKYTALLCLPMLLLGIEAPRRAGWRFRGYLVASVIIAIIAGPWFVRNWYLTGNPVYPTEVNIGSVTLLPGMFKAHHSPRLAGLANLVETFTGSASGAGYYNPSIASWLIMLTAWMFACVRERQTILREPLKRLVLIGPPIGICAFILISPFAETRFIAAAFVLLFASIVYIRPGFMSLTLAGIAVVTSVTTAFKPEVWRQIYPFVLGTLASAVTMAALVEFSVTAWKKWRRLILGIWTGAGIAMLGVIFVFWNAYLASCKFTAVDGWKSAYSEDLPEAWRFVRENCPADEPLAYANSYFVYPLMGYELDRPIVYVPVRRGVKSIRDLGRLDQPVAGEQIGPAVVAVTNRDSDESLWRANLRACGATHLFIGREDLSGSGMPAEDRVPELRWVSRHPEWFPVAFNNTAAIIVEVRLPR